MLKTHGCGELRAEHDGEQVTLAGWVHRRRDHGGLLFLDLRDSTGLVQVVVHPEHAPAAMAIASEVRNEFVLRIDGLVSKRLPGTENVELATGAIEVQAATVEVLNSSETPPFPINQDSDPGELTRLRYRYLDLRRERMARNLRLRHRVVKLIRDFMDARAFIEVETPVLGLATPEGARDYLVPSRVHPGSFYALPQSPQQWKQLLMVAGVDRYFQIARCYRDEDLRADRQPEFTQLDVEMAFVEEEDVLSLTEELYQHLAAELAPERPLPSPFPRMTYAEAMERFGSDKPDLRYGVEIADLTNHVRESEFRVFADAIAAGGRVRAIVVPGGGATPRREVDRLTEMAKEAGARGLVWVQFAGAGALDTLTDDDVKSPVGRFFTPAQLGSLGAACGAVRGDMLLIAADRDAITSRVLDVLRRHIAEAQALADPNALAFAFITQFPMFEWDETAERWSAVHHLFTSPFSDDYDLIESDPGSVRSRAYDIICNGQEIASGSIRIHRREILLRVLKTLGMSLDEAKARFGHMLEAFTFGAPPHGGIAPGIDRTVAIFAGERDIREVIAFPKTKSAADAMTGAPAPVSSAQLTEVHIALDAAAREALEQAASREA
ncbi:MAG: aspartate--tRNA ligase [Chloroflexi bacterium]|nr:aspartate--tRNA ligase [Chloroflexota bacterium]MDA1003523.1 aspartate--tRNA ligase [Chloroflexota bacterium]MQC27859.1 aspartate--tRNA ligase [Chloroflexota bacterium]